MLEERKRLDVLLLEKGIFESREKAKEGILEGNVFVNGKRVNKCSTKVESSAVLEFKGEKLKYVGRGGLKLEKAIRKFNINLNEKVCLDIGASTGGFTDCMLQSGAKKVFAIDVGYGQLSDKLRKDSRVICIEKYNVRYIDEKDIGEYADFASIDVSFISIEKLLVPLTRVLKDNAEIVALIKPQFEAGKNNIGKNGIVKNESIQIKVILKLIEFLNTAKLEVLGLDFSPIKGSDGNIEFLIHMKKKNTFITLDNKKYNEDFISNVVIKAHKYLNGDRNEDRNKCK